MTRWPCKFKIRSSEHNKSWECGCVCSGELQLLLLQNSNSNNTHQQQRCNERRGRNVRDVGSFFNDVEHPHISFSRSITTITTRKRRHREIKRRRNNTQCVFHRVCWTIFLRYYEVKNRISFNILTLEGDRYGGRGGQCTTTVCRIICSAVIYEVLR